MKRISYKKTLRTTLGLMLLFLSTALVLNSCYPGEELTAEDTDIVATFYDKEADFTTKLTYAIKDSVIRLDEDGNPIYNETGPYDQQAINRIKDNMEAAGFTEKADHGFSRCYSIHICKPDNLGFRRMLFFLV